MPNRILANNRPLELSPRAFSALLRFQRPAFLAFEPRQCRELCHGVQGLWAQLAPEFPELLFGRVSCVAATGILGEGACSVASASLVAEAPRFCAPGGVRVRPLPLPVRRTLDLLAAPPADFSRRA